MKQIAGCHTAGPVKRKPISELADMMNSKVGTAKKYDLDVAETLAARRNGERDVVLRLAKQAASAIRYDHGNGKRQRKMAVCNRAKVDRPT